LSEASSAARKITNSANGILSYIFMTINIKPIESQAEWQTMENRLAPHTFLQSWEWGEAQQALGQKIFRLGIFKDDRLIGLAFIYLIKAKRGSFLFCPHGPLINWGQTEEIMPILLRYLIALGREEKADFIRFSPLAPDTGENKNIFASLGFRPAPVHLMHPELAWLLDLRLPLEELFNNLEKHTRYSIRKAQKDGVTIKTGADVAALDEFYELYKQTANRQKFVPFTKDYLKKELAAFVKNDKIMLYFAYYQAEPIATAMIIFSHDSAFYHHGASSRKFTKAAASELIQWTAISEAKSRGLKFYNFWGIAPEASPNHPWAGLTKFKRGFSGKSEAYLHAQDYILTKKYWLNYLIEKLRKLKRGY